MALGTHTYGGSTPSSPTAIQNHFLANVVVPAKREMTLISQFARQTKITGLSVTLPSYKKLAIPNSVNSANEYSTVQLSRVEFDGKSANLAFFDHGMEFSKAMVDRNQGIMPVIDILKDELQQELALRLELIHKAALDEGKLVFTPRGYTSFQVDTNGTPSQQATNNLSVYHYQYLDLLASDHYAIPKIASMGCYAYLTRGGAAFSLLQDPLFQAIHTGVPDYLMKNSVGQIGDIKIFKSPEEELFSSSLGVNSNVSEGVLLGNQSMEMFFNKPFEFHMDTEDRMANNFGRSGYMWYRADLGVTLPTDSVEKRRVRHIRVTSA